MLHNQEQKWAPTISDCLKGRTPQKEMGCRCQKNRLESKINKQHPMHTQHLSIQRIMEAQSERIEALSKQIAAMATGTTDVAGTKNEFRLP